MARFLNTFKLIKARFVVKAGVSRKSVEGLLGPSRKSIVVNNRTVAVYSYYKAVPVERSWLFHVVNAVFFEYLLYLCEGSPKRKFYFYITYDDKECIESVSTEPPKGNTHALS